VHCYLQLKLCGKQQSVDLLLDAQQRTDVSRSNEQCEEERIYIRWFIEDVCYLPNQELLFRGHDGLSNILNKREFVGFLNFLKNHEPIHQKIMSNQPLLLNVQYKFGSIFK
jgi:hypothetical protein